MSDALLLQHFRGTVDGVFPTATTDIVTRVHGILLTKIHNARSNDQLGKLSALQKKKKKGSGYVY